MSGFTANHRPKKNLSEPNPSLFDDMFPDRLLELVDAKGLLGLNGRVPRNFPQSSPRPALELAKYLAGIGDNPKLTKSGNSKALNDLRALGIARFERRSGELVIEVPSLSDSDGAVVESVLRDLMETMPGALEAF